VYRWVDHAAEVELEIEAPGEGGVLEDALLALAELLGIEPAGSEETRPVGHKETRPVGHEETRSLAVQAGDRPALLAAWIEELAFLAESEGFVATRVLELELGSREVRATVAGVLGEPPPLVKAVTYHRLAFEPGGPGYVARVVLDV
jgi:SHS2 domain-containing protein